VSKDNEYLPLESTEVPRLPLANPIPILLVLIYNGGTWECEPVIKFIFEVELPYN